MGQRRQIEERNLKGQGKKVIEFSYVFLGDVDINDVIAFVLGK